VAPSPPQLSFLPTPDEQVRYGKSAVPAAQLALAEQALAFFNQYSGSQLRARKGNGQPSESLKRIIGAVLAYPDVPLEGWRAAIEAALAEPWWQGRPSVGCVFGPNVVERNLFPARPIESAQQRREREKFERRARGRAAMQRLKGGDDLLPVS